MIKITKLKECDKISSPICGYIKMKLKQMIEEYSVESISDFGAIYLIENYKDIENFNAMGFNEPISHYIPEYIKRIHINDGFQDISYLESCFIFSDGYGIVIIGKEHLFKKYLDVDKYLLEN